MNEEILGVFEEILKMARSIDISSECKEFDEEVGVDEEVVGDLSGDEWMQRYTRLHAQVSESLEGMNEFTAIRAILVMELVEKAMRIRASDITGESPRDLFSMRRGLLVVKKMENSRPPGATLH